MNAYHLFLLVLFVYISFLIVTGIYFNRKSLSQTDFWLAGKSAGFLSIGFSAAASWLTAGAILAVIGFYILLGMGSVWGFVAPNILASLVTKPSEKEQLAPFFKEEAIISMEKSAGKPGFMAPLSSGVE